MKIFTALLLIALPAAARAGGMHGGGQWHGGGSAHAAIVFYGLFAALGYWVLQHAAKETAGFVKKTGVALGMALVIIGLMGVLCGVGSHIKTGLSRHCSCAGGGAMMHGGSGIMMHDEDEDKIGEKPAMPEAPKAPEPAKKKTK